VLTYRVGQLRVYKRHSAYESRVETSNLSRCVTYARISDGGIRANVVYLLRSPPDCCVELVIAALSRRKQGFESPRERQ